MFQIKGKYTTAKVYTDNVEPEAISQIYELCNQSFADGAKIRIMPDVHSGKGCVVGFTADLGDKVVPNLVGVDQGCGMEVVALGKIKPDLGKLDNIIRKYIPSGRNVRTERWDKFDIDQLHCARHLKGHDYIERSIGTLGGGNHFIEMNVDDEGNHFIVIHSGSRSLGKQVADYYQNLAIQQLSGTDKDTLRLSREKIIEELSSQGKQREISKALAEFSKNAGHELGVPKHLAYLSGELREQYLDDMNVCVEFARKNRKAIAVNIMSEYFTISNMPDFTSFTTIHNYIDTQDGIIRKGAVRADKGETLIIPMNMRDGSLICVGKGDPDWNNSAPHGAGRLMSRTKAKETLKVDDFIQSMNGIYSTSIGLDTLDEAPDAYKPMEQILEHIGETVEVVKVIRPIYNFKASS